MKIKTIKLEKFKRFSELKILNIPESAKLIVLVGPNGCGKSSIFDAFKVWQLYHGFSFYPSDQRYCNKILDQNERIRNSNELVEISFHDYEGGDTEINHQSFYFRTAYRNEAALNIPVIERIEPPTKNANHKMMIENDQVTSDNYKRLVSKTLERVYDSSYDNTKVATLRDELIGKIRKALLRLFGDLELLGIGNPSEHADFYFRKGITTNYSYKNLSGGEKAAFDLLLDLVIKQEYFHDTIFCIDEPEAHMHTALQAGLLEELYNFINDRSQLWIATHSLGMLQKACELEKNNPGCVFFLSFDGYDFDDVVQISPSPITRGLWNKIFDLTLSNYANLIVPETVVFCEGSIQGRRRKDFDARCYSNIFEPSRPRVAFYSSGGCNDLEDDKSQFIPLVKTLAPAAKIIKVIDRDDRSEAEIQELSNKGIKVLARRHIESYLLDDEILIKWCNSVGRSDQIQEALRIKEEAIKESVENRGNPIDDIKSAGNKIVTDVKKLLGVTSCGNNGESIMRDTLSPLITPDTQVYHELEEEIFS